MTRLILFTLVAMMILAFSCIREKHGEYIAHDSTDDPIILINIKEYGRDSITAILNHLANCNPKTIGLNARFQVFTGSKTDSLLADAIRLTGKVVLSDSRNSKNQILESHYFFSSNANKNGMMILSGENDIATKYMPLYEDSHGQRLSFPFHLAFAFDPDKAETIFKDFRVNGYRNIVYRKTLQEFTVLAEDEIYCENVDGKIVILGVLGPGDEDLVRTPLDEATGNSESKTRGTVIAANIVLDILNGNK